MSSPTSTPACPLPLSPTSSNKEDLLQLSVAELKKRVHELGLSTSDCFEKSDLVAKLQRGLADTNTKPRTAATTSSAEDLGQGGGLTTSTLPHTDRKYHRASCGYATVQGRVDWLAAHGVKEEKDIDTISNSLVPDLNPTAPLYYWQLFSLLGVNRIQALVRLFYQNVYADTDAPWFQEAFARISSMDHHIKTQTQFWCDVMGGGKYYHGGDHRLRFHHTQNADVVMNARGAQRWMYHMRRAVELNEADATTSFAVIDPRVLPCLKDFLHTKMMKYANEHSWTFDESDFDKFPK